MNTSLSPERWDQVQRLFDEVVDLDAAARAARLDEACRDDPDLRAEVDSLLEAYAQADEVLHELDRMAGSSAGPSSRTGSRVVRYEVREKLGGGGMGVVYKAFDTRLKRIVALKFLPPRLGINKQARQRFEREAQAASALDHSNICTIYEIGEAGDGQSFIAMACYEGETLRQKIVRGGLTAEQALDYATQIARGLERAHEAGIIHRDIKPANVIVTDRGVVKILDFGLAKMAGVQLTQTGRTLGTVAYMSPEQARGEHVDHRTDLWSLGVVLYEMLTGQRPFKGEYAEAVIYSILHEAPRPITELRGDLPPELVQVVARCLQKGKERRYETASALLADLEAWQRRLAPNVDRAVAERAQARARRNGILAGVGVLMALLLLVAVPSVRQAVGDVLGLTGLPAQKHLVVLPFTTDDAGAVYAGGLTETLTGKLAGLEPFEEALWVVPARDVRRRNIADPGAALQIFGANLAITGEVVNQQDSIRVTLVVVDTESLKTLKKETVADRWENAAALQNDLALAVAGLLDLDLQPQTRRLLTAGATPVPGAYEFYLQGQGYLQRYEQPEQINLAIELFDQALQEDRVYALAYAGLCEAYWRKFEATKDVQWAELAEQQCDRAIELDDGLTSVYLTLGMIHTGTGRYGPALADFKHVLDREPSNAAAYRGRAQAYLALDRLPEAEASYREAIALKPDYWGGYNDLAVFFFRQGRYEEAATQFEQVVRLTPDNVRGFNGLGGAYINAGRPQDAIRAWEQALVVDPTYTIIYSNLATVYYWNQDYTEAARMYEKALAINEKNYEFWANLGHAYYWSGTDRDKARGAWQRLIDMSDEWLAVNPRDTRVLSLLARTHEYLGQREQALALIERIENLQPEDQGSLTMLAAVYEHMDDREQALAWIEKAAERGLSFEQIERDPWFNALRGDARYDQLYQRFQPDVRPEER